MHLEAAIKYAKYFKTKRSHSEVIKVLIILKWTNNFSFCKIVNYIVVRILPNQCKFYGFFLTAALFECTYINTASLFERTDIKMWMHRH